MLNKGFFFFLSDFEEPKKTDVTECEPDGI